jgi:hypothetical protein
MMENNMLPHFLCIGAQKAATSWLWAMLRQNPGIWMPPVKELHFFDHVHIPENRTWTLGHIRNGVTENLKWHIQNNVINFGHFRYLIDMGTKEPFTESWYRACFDRPGASGKRVGDITPEYSTMPEEGVQHVRDLLGPDLRIIYMIRSPLERALSQLKMNLTRRGQEKMPEDFWLTAAKDPVLLQRGDYLSYIPRWEKIFPRENILYLPYRRVNGDPAGLLHDVDTHIGVTPYSGYAGVSERVHRTRDAKVPQKCVSYLKDALADQNHFLLERFGSEFVDLI